MERLATVASVVWQYLLGFDIFIFVVAAVNLYCYIISRRIAEGLRKTLHMTIFLPEYALKNGEIEPARISEAELVDTRKRANGYYSIYINLTGIFPLLGILGTVISLIPMAADMSNAQQNFFAALTSTLWGLVFAIIFKFLDGFLAARMEENSSNIDLFLERNKKNEESKETRTGYDSKKEAPCVTEE